MIGCMSVFLFFFNDTATTEIYTLSLHDALPISAHPAPDSPDHHEARRVGVRHGAEKHTVHDRERGGRGADPERDHQHRRSEEHTSELQSRQYLVCRLLLEKKKNTTATLSEQISR